jgi:hypothetical protein
MCKSLVSVTFESGSRLERIEEFAFASTRLKSIKIPGSVTSHGVSAFDGRYLNSVSVSPANVRFRVREHCLEDFDGSKIYVFFGSRHSIVIPSSVVVLDKLSFYKRRSLESVTFESGSRLERIEDSAFSESGLRSIVIPSSVIVLGRCSFLRCKSLHSVTFESGSRSERIEMMAFHGTLLKSITIPSSVVVEGNYRSSSSSEMQIIYF